MTDNEIIKALECCTHKERMCGKCTLQEECLNDVCVLEKHSLDLINHQRAEIERLSAMVEAAEDYLRPLPFTNTFDEYISKKKAEAIKEFAERLKDAFPEGNRDAKCPALYFDDYCYIVDELAEKMVGEK